MRITVRQLRRIIRESVHQVLLEDASAEEAAEAVASAASGLSKDQLAAELEDVIPLPYLRKFLTLPRRQAVPFFSAEQDPSAAWLATWQAADALVHTRDLF